MSEAAAVNGGDLYKPHIAKEWVDPRTEKVVDTFEPEIKDKVISEDTSKEVRYALENVVAKGSGKSAYVDGYRVGGKTGTAQKVGPDGNYMKNNYVVFFIVFVSDAYQEIVVIILNIEHNDTI